MCESPAVSTAVGGSLELILPLLRTRRHGITNAPNGGEMCVNSTGRCVTIWPAGPAMGSSFNRSMWGVIGHTTGVEMRALNNAQWGPSARPGVGLDGAYVCVWGRGWGHQHRARV